MFPNGDFITSQKGCTGVPELKDDATISSSFLSELPLTQGIQCSQTAGNLRLTSSDKEKNLFHQPRQNVRNVHQRNSLLFNHGTEIRRKNDNTAIDIQRDSLQDYVSPYKTSFTPVSDQSFADDGIFLHSDKSSHVQNEFLTQTDNFPSSYNKTDSHFDFDSPVHAAPKKRSCFQFSQMEKEDGKRWSPFNGDTNLQSFAPRSSQRLTQSLLNNDDNLFVSTPCRRSEVQRNPPDSGFVDFRSPLEALNTPAPLCIPGPDGDGNTARLRSIEEIPSFRPLFNFPYFNKVQSLVFDDVLYTDKPLVVSAPTGAGKTVIFELAIIRLLTMFGDSKKNWKIVYVAPIKALCSERYLDWQKKFQPFGLTCLELTGDTEMDHISELHRAQLILTTPEKWDSMSRKWKDNRSLFQTIALFLTDEIHILNDSMRGSTIEAVISRMKTLRLANKNTEGPNMRFVAVSATIPNIEDLASWLGSSTEPASNFNLGEQYRPVKLMKIVVGYPFKDGTSDFRFDMNLAYRLKGIIEMYSNNKPTLVFCSSRKSVEQTADVLKKENNGRSFLKSQNREAVQMASHTFRETKIADMVRYGIGVHHAGLGASDRKQVEELFRNGLLPILISTSTLAMGVNLPAHLVVIKSTVFYSMGSPTEYSDSQVLQMIGRAGRPQFDTSATAVIMTKTTTKSKYESLVNGTQKIESSLHKQLIEHLNAEIVLHTITDMALAIEWIRHTFLYVRIMKNPTHYGYPPGLNKSQVEKRLEDLCLKNLNELAGLKLVEMDPETYSINPTETGKLMARYCIAFDTMKKFHTIGSDEDTKEMIELLVSCSEFDEFIQLRNNEKSTLNALNKNKNKQTIRYPVNGRIKTKQMKTNCLLQAQLSCLSIQDFSLSQDVNKIFRVGQRVAKCLMEFLWQRKDYCSLLTAIELLKCMKTKLWVDSKHVAKQLDGIGPTMSQSLVSAGMTSFQKMEETNPRELELIVNRHPPFGNQVRDALSVLPKYELSIEQLKNYKTSSCELVLSVGLANRELIENKKGTTEHQSVLLIGDQDNNIVFNWRIYDKVILKDISWRRKVDVTRAQGGPELFVHLVSQDYVGLDIHTTYVPVYQWSIEHSRMTNYSLDKENSERTSGQTSRKQAPASRPSTPGPRGMRGGQCQHKCLNKAQCGHLCCKDGQTAGQYGTGPNMGIVSRAPKQSSGPSRVRERKGIDAQITNLKNKASSIPIQPSALKKQRLTGGNHGMGLQQFAYQRPASMQPSLQQQAHARQPVMGNMPVFNYGVGGRRINTGPSHRQPMGVVEMNQSDFGNFEQEVNFDVMADEDASYFTEPLTETNDLTNDMYRESFNNMQNQNSKIMNNERTKNDTFDNRTSMFNEAACKSKSDTFDERRSCSNRFHQRTSKNMYNEGTSKHNINKGRSQQNVMYNERRGYGIYADSTDLDGVFDSDDMDTPPIQQVPSAEPSRSASPHHFSQDDWAELHLYQQDREMSPGLHEEQDVYVHENEQNVSAGIPNYQNRGYTRHEDLELGNMGKFINEANGNSRPTTVNNRSSYYPRVTDCFKSTTDFLASNSSDDDLWYAEEICSQDMEEYQDLYSEHKQDWGHQNPKQVDIGDEVQRRFNEKPLSRSNNQHQNQSSKSPGHRFGQVVAWVADSDSSPSSQKSNPKSKTPLFKKMGHKLNPPKRDVVEDSFGEQNKSLKQGSNSDLMFPKAAPSSSFFHVFRPGKSEDHLEASGNIFAGVF